METIFETCFFAALIFPPIVFVYVVWRLQRISAGRRALVGGLFACAAFASLMILAVSFFFGSMGPDAVVRHGIYLLADYGDEIVLAIVAGGILAAFGIILATYKEKNVRRSGLKAVVCIFLVMGGSWIARDVLDQAITSSELKPNVFSTAEPKWLADSGYQFGFDAREALVISNWISTSQGGWEFGSEDDFQQRKPQLACDNYTIQIDSNRIVMQYYKSEADYTGDPSDAFIIIKRPLSAGDQAFWARQVDKVKAAAKVAVKVP